MRYILKNWITLLFLLSLISIVSALVAEFIFDLTPCNMCFKQRYSYYVIILIVPIFFFIKFLKKIWLLIIAELSILYGLVYAIWHVGIEKKVILGPASCSGILEKTNSIENLKDQINNQAVVNCADPSWLILGFSAATINSILLLFMLIINSVSILNQFYDQKKI